jgi:energy-coupling factor transporter ATP-binding protein EcfA2
MGAPNGAPVAPPSTISSTALIVLDPDVLLLDEPTSALDPRSQSQVIDLIQDWKSSSKT